jgi:RNA polymerase sigma-70 factor (ECF subfamily)
MMKPELWISETARSVNHSSKTLVKLPIVPGRAAQHNATVDKTPLSLLERLRQPADHAAWSRFVELYTPMLFRWARSVGLAVAEAGDLVQDVLLLLMRKLPEFTYDPTKSFRGWLKAVTINKWRENYRKATPLPKGDHAVVLEELPADSDNVFEEMEYRRQLVHRAMELIRTDFEATTWQAAWEYVVEGRPAEAVGRELGLSVNAVYLAKSRVLRRLRSELDRLLD